MDDGYDTALGSWSGWLKQHGSATYFRGSREFAFHRSAVHGYCCGGPVRSRVAGKGTSHGPGPNPEVGGSVQGAAIVMRRSLAGVLLLFSLQIVGANVGAEERDAALDINIDFDALHYANSDPTADNPPEDLAPGWDRNPRVDWSRRVGRSWELDPVLLHRRQAGQPQQPGDDLSNKTLGIELRRRF